MKSFAAARMADSPLLSLRVGATGWGLGVGVGVGIGLGSPLDLATLPVVGPGLAQGIAQAQRSLAGVRVKKTYNITHQCQ